MLRCSSMRLSRISASVLPLSPNNRSNSARGLFSIGSGVVGVRHAIVFEYAQAKPTSQDPETSRLSRPTSSDASCVCLPRSLAMCWSIETPACSSYSDGIALRPVRNRVDALA